MKTLLKKQTVIRYRGFLLIKEQTQSWLVRPERSPMKLLPFRASMCSVIEVKKILDVKLSLNQQFIKAA